MTRAPAPLPAGRSPAVRVAALAACVALGSGAARAQDVGALLEASRPAVARLLYPGGSGGAATSGCTGVATTGGSVLTAGHCLGPEGAGRPDVALDDRTLRPTGGARHPDATDAPGPTDLGRLDLPAPAPGLAVGKAPRPGEVLLLIGYRNDMGGARSELFCAVLRVEAGAALVACPVQNGLSGAPLIRDGPDGPEIAAIVVGRAGLSALAAIPDAWARGE